MKKPFINIVIRLEKSTGQPLVCCHNGRVFEGKHQIDKDILVYFTNARYHAEVSTQWYYRDTEPIADLVLAQKLYDKYTKDWEGESTPRLRNRLDAQKKGYEYGYSGRL